ncbi:MAG TPA: oxygen-independent coproporphyrinogen III oxidase [Parafilimonas sp.]|nr:oxygen-independent coproporphyrinogen III oxidase [Parafilimonas sp.]
MNNLLSKYNLPVPRYTSYPTLPFWYPFEDQNKWIDAVKAGFCNNMETGISLYIHLPFCESLCTYCGCNKKITTNHSVEEIYINAVLHEWKLYRALFDEPPLIRELHLGGGTPTFFSPQNLDKLLEGIFKQAVIHPGHEFSIEGHPNNTTAAHIKTLSELGFKRISLGVQDNDAQVQKIINRIQPFENVQKVTQAARDHGFESVNFDLIYGLPLQTTESITRTIEQCISLQPDRVAFYSYAHVPWTSKAQRLFDENDLPSPEEKLALYTTGKKLFIAHGYHDIGMDHFALPKDKLYQAWLKKDLHRNFMGYTTQSTNMLIGLGVSAISDAGDAFAQNDKLLHNYYQMIGRNELAVVKGYFLSNEDLAFRKYIRDISCMGETNFQPQHFHLLQQYVFPKLQELESDNLVEWDECGLTVTDTGRNFIRNICNAFDLHHFATEKMHQEQRYSKAI